ncbi:MAG: HlyD family efflux transporter periplasmic adaptor subunit [Defluviitaleaceae bacterium]|nr:HlyD family efflux transporter periplasmic adaptor subunit [Defluviitaleaceae bacterium]
MRKLICLTGAVVVAGVLVGCSGVPEPNTMPMTAFAESRVGNGGIDVITVRGVVESVESRSIYSTLGFLIDNVYVEIGDVVSEGQILAVLDTADLELMIAQQRVELEVLRQMVEIIPPQRQAELANLRRVSSLAPRQHQAELDVIRQHNENMVLQSQRMLAEANANLTNNTNMHIVQAEAALTAAEVNLTAARRNYEIARGDRTQGNNPHVQNAESAYNSARIHLETTETNHERFELLYEAGGMSRNELRQSENALVQAQNAYNDARTNRENASESEGRTLEQLEIALYAAVTTYENAQALLETTRLAANQEIDMLRSNLAAAEIAANTEPLEIAANMARVEIASSVEAMEHAINLEIKELNAALERTEIALQILERQMEDSVITAPISGTVTASLAREGAIGAGLMFIVEDTDNLRVMTRFREYDIGLIEQGMEVAVRADATGNAVHEGIINRINPAAVHGSPIVEFEVEVAISAQDTGLRIGMNTRIEVNLEDEEPIIEPTTEPTTGGE